MCILNSFICMSVSMYIQGPHGAWWLQSQEDEAGTWEPAQQMVVTHNVGAERGSSARTASTFHLCAMSPASQIFNLKLLL